MITWEQTKLPSPSTLRVKHSTSTQRKRMESGRFQIRRRYTTDYEEGVISFQFCDKDFQIFKGVWAYGLGNGSDWFFIDLPVGGDFPTVQCKVRFIADYTYNYTNVGNSVVSAKIEFFRVEQPTEETFNNLSLTGQESPYLKENLYVHFANVENPSSSSFSFKVVCDSTLSTNVAVQWWDGTVDIYSHNTFITKATPSGYIGKEYRCIVWACKSATDSEPYGKINDFYCYQNTITLFHSLELTELDKAFLYDSTNLQGEFGNEVLQIPIKPNMSNVGLTKTDNIEKLVLNAYDVNSTLDTLSLTNSLTSELSVMGRNLSSSVSDLVEIKTLNLDRCSWDNLNLGNVKTETVIIRYTEMEHLTIGQINGSILSLQDNNLNSITIRHGFNSPNGSVSNLINNNLSVTDIYNHVDIINNTGSHTINLLGNPCWVNNALDPQHPETAATEALALSKGITLTA